MQDNRTSGDGHDEALRGWMASLFVNVCMLSYTTTELTTEEMEVDEAMERAQEADDLASTLVNLMRADAVRDLLPSDAPAALAEIKARDDAINAEWDAKMAAAHAHIPNPQAGDRA